MAPDQQPLHVGVLGAGTIGTFVGGKLAAAGARVTLVGRRPLPASADISGLRLTDVEGTAVELPLSGFTWEVDPQALSACAVVLCCVKSGQTDEAARALAAHLRPGAAVVSFQNGVRNPEVLRRHLGSWPVLAGIVGFNVITEADRSFRQTTSGQLIIEASTTPASQTLAELLARAGFKVRVAPNVRELQWSKLVLNLNNAVSALSGAPTREILLSPGYRRCLAAIMAEAIGVLYRSGIRPANLTGVPIAWFPALLGLPTPLFRLLARTQIKVDPQARSSMWDDLSRRRPTEVEELNGEVVRLAAASSLKAPLNQRIVSAVHQAEVDGRGSPQLSAEALWAMITGAG